MSQATVRGWVRESANFLRSFAAHPRQVGAVLPTSQQTVRTLLELAPLDRASCVVELGAGTGPFTGEILRRLSPEATFLCFEIDPSLAAILERKFSDPRMRVIADSAEKLEIYLEGRRPEVIVSALPFTSLPAAVRTEVLAVTRRVLAPGGAFLVLQYSPFVQGDLQRTFDRVERHLSPLNVPPAVLFACRADGAARA